MSEELIEIGNIIRFINRKPCNTAIISSVGLKDVRLTVIEDDTFTEASITLQLDEFKRDIANKHIRFLCCEKDFGELVLTDLKESEQNEVLRRIKYLNSLMEQGITTITEKNAKEAIDKIAVEYGDLPPHWQTVRSWWEAYKEGNFKSKSLFPNHKNKGCKRDKANKIDKKIIEIINGVAGDYYSEKQPTMASMERSVKAQINEYNLKNPASALKVPTYRTIRKRILNYPYEKKMIKRVGKNTMRAERSYKRNTVQSEFVLDRVEIDHTHMDIHVLHDKHKTLAGRPNLTALVDHHSHMLLGFQMSFEACSTAALSLACYNAFTAKTIHKSLGIKYSWPARGLPKTLVADNGNEFWSKSFSTTASELGFTLQYCPIKSPTYKGRCERFFGIMNSLFLDNLPGVVRKPDKCGESYDATQEATLTFSDLKARFLLWVTGIYHNLPIEDENMATANELWKSSEEILPIHEEKDSYLRLALLSTFYPTLGKNGIKRVNQEYGSSALRDLYRRDGSGKITAKYNPFDLGMIYVLDKKSQQYIPVKNKDFHNKQGVSEYEAAQIRKEANQIKNEKLTHQDIIEAGIKLENQRLEDHERNKRRKKQVTTAKSARVEKIGVEDINPIEEVDLTHKQEQQTMAKKRIRKGWSK